MKLILQLVGAAVIISLFVAIMICLDGAVDQGQKADVGLVLSREHVPLKGSDPVLDHAVNLFNEGDFGVILVNSHWPRADDAGPSEAAKYLAKHGIDVSVIIDMHSGDDVPATAKETVKELKGHTLQTVMVVADYYRITRMKVVLGHEGVTVIDKAHVGKISSDDAGKIAGEVFALYGYMARTFVLPMASKVKDEASDQLQKAKVDTAKAKETVNKGLDSLPK